MKIGDKVKVSKVYDSYGWDRFRDKIGIVRVIQGNGSIGAEFKGIAGHSLFDEIDSSNGWWFASSDLMVVRKSKSKKKLKKKVRRGR